MKISPKLFYLTIDNLNAATAEALAAEHGFPLEVIEPRDLPGLGEGAAVILDWDYLPEDVRSNLVESVAITLVAVHGHNLGDVLAGFLTKRNIACSSSLDRALFRSLAGTEAAA
jgi:hypothetical protein